MMRPLFRDGQRPPQKALEIIVGYMRRVAHPVYLGYVSLEVGWSLRHTEEMMQELERRGLVRQLGPEESAARGFRQDGYLWELTQVSD